MKTAEEEILEEESLLESFYEPKTICLKIEESDPEIEIPSEFTISRYEYSKLICKRIDQLSQGQKPRINIRKIPERLRNSAYIAKKELEEGKLPLKIIRVFPLKKKIQILRLYGKKIKDEDIK